MPKDVKRIVNTSFWEDEKVVNLFSPEDKYFMLYLLTNPHTSQLGIYRLVPKVAAFELGYSIEAVVVLLERFEKKYGIIKYSKETSEIAIKNYLKHSIIKGGKPVMDCLLKDESKVKDKSLLGYIYNSISNTDTLNITVKEYIDHINNNDNDNERFVNESYHESSDDNVINSKVAINDCFEKLWKMYPRKLGKGQIKDATKKRIYDIGFDQMSRCIDRYKDYVFGKDEQYIMYGSTFFNSGYVDYLDENYPNKFEDCPEEKEEPVMDLWGDD